MQQRRRPGTIPIAIVGILHDWHDMRATSRGADDRREGGIVREAQVMARASNRQQGRGHPVDLADMLPQGRTAGVIPWHIKGDADRPHGGAFAPVRQPF